jgi:hypothetical protein
MKDKKDDWLKTPALAVYMKKFDRLGCYIARAGDLPPNNTVMWCGLARRNDIHLGCSVALRLVGN